MRGVVRLLALVLALAATPILAIGPPAQAATAPELTAAFLLNFVRFTTWPARWLPDNAPIVACIAGDERVASSFRALAKAHPIPGRPLEVQRAQLGDTTGCHLVFAAGLKDSDADQLIRATAYLPILTVSDGERFCERGGVARFFVENGKMRFAVNPEAADRAQLRVSSRLLSLSQIVKDKNAVNR